MLLEGSFLMTGVNVLSIVPFIEEMLTANIFISNNDIALIEEGMAVRYDIPAMPRRDFGEITGNITRISADASTSDGLLGYFLVESLLEDRVYYDTRGNGANLRIGMHFDSRITVNRQRILFYLLDQVNLNP
jgi:HlyD family secretion protein